jgi:hypothetical protein
MDAHRTQMEAQKRIEKVKTLPLMSTDDTDLKTGEQGLPRMNADERGSEKQGLPLISTENTDLKRTTAEGGCATQASLVAEVCANRGQTAEIHANLG